MKNTILATIASLTVIIPFGGLASARTQSANLGTARVGSQVTMFSYDFGSGAVTASGSADWTLGLVTDSPGPKLVRVTARATTTGALVRVVSNNAVGTAFAATPFQPIPMSTTYLPLDFSLNVPDHGVAFLDAIMNPGASIDVTEFNQ